jgi:hypothetical protein
MYTSTSAVLVARKSLLGLLAVSLTSCTSFNPYQRTDLASEPLEKSIRQARAGGSTPLAGGLDGALLVLRDQQSEWYGALSSQARVRAVAQLSVMGLSVAALYGALKPGATHSVASRNLALAGSVGAVAYTGSDWYLVPEQEDAYIVGMRKLSCAALQIEPFKMTQAELDSTVENTEALHHALSDLDAALSSAEAVMRYAETDTSAAAAVRREARRARSQGNSTLAASVQLQQEVKNSGDTLLRAGEFIFADVAASIRAVSQPLKDPSTTLTRYKSIVTAYQKVDATPEATATAPEKQAPESVETPASPASQPAGVAATASAPKEATNNLTSVSKASPTVLMEELVARLNAGYAKAAAALEAKFKKQLGDAHKASTLASQAAGNANASAVRALAACKKSTGTDCELPTDTVSIELAQKTADVYTARRPLSSQLLAFSKSSKANAANRACTASAQSMTVSPAEDASVAPGAPYAIVLGNLPVPPAVTVTGPATYVLEVTAPGTYTLRMAVKDEAVGTVQIRIIGLGGDVEDITLTVKPSQSATS